jgi:hypothetical protein
MSRTCCITSRRASRRRPWRQSPRTRRSTSKSGRESKVEGRRSKVDRMSIVDHPIQVVLSATTQYPRVIGHSRTADRVRLYHHSHQTFLSMTSQRSLHSSSRSVLFPSETTVAHGSPASKPAPSNPTTPRHGHGHGHRRDLSGASDAGGAGAGPIVFREIGEEAGEGIWRKLERSLGEAT